MWGAPVGWVSSCKVSRSFRNRLTACVVTREDGLVLGDTVDVGLNDTSQKGVVQVSEIVTVAIAVSSHSAVDTCRVAVPKVHVDSRNRLARAGVNKLNIEVKRNTLLAIGDVATDELSIDVVRTLGDFGLKDTSRVVGEEKSLVVAVGIGNGLLVGVVVCGEVAADERGADAALGASLAGHCLAAGEGVLHVTPATELRSAGVDRVWGPLDEIPALKSLFRNIVAWVCEDSRQGEETKGQKR